MEATPPARDRSLLDLAASARAAAVGLAFIAGMRLAIPDDSAGPGMETLVACLAPTLLAALVAIGAARGSLRLPAKRVFVPFLILALWTLAAIRWAPERHAALDVALQRLSEACVVGVALLALADGTTARRRLQGVVLGLAALAAAHALLQVLIIHPGMRQDFESSGLIDTVPPEDRAALLSRLGSNRATGPFAVANQLAGLLLMALPLAVAGALWRGAARGVRVASAGLAVLLVTGLALSGSKGGLAAAAAGLALLAGGGRPRRTVLALAALAVLAGAALVVPAVRAAAMPSLEVRLGYFSVALDVWQEAPVLGIGPGQYPDGFFRHKPPEVEEARHAHDAYLETMAELGLTGLALLLLAWLTPVLRGLRADPSSARDTGEARPGGAPELVAMLAGVGAAMAIARVLTAHGSASTGVSWLVTASLLGAAAAGFLIGARLPLSRRVVAVGALALLVHAAVDFDLETPGLASLAALVVALAAPGAEPAHVATPGARARVAIALLALLVCFGISSQVGVRNLEADAGRATFLEPPPGSALEREARIAATSRAMTLDPLDPALPLRRARLLLDGSADAGGEEQGAMELEARHWLDRAASLAPRDAGIAFERAQVYEAHAAASGDTALARTALDGYRAAVAAYPASPQMRLRLGLLAASLGDEEEGRAEARMALELDARVYERDRPRVALSESERELAEQLAGAR